MAQWSTQATVVSSFLEVLVALPNNELMQLVKNRIKALVVG